MPATGTSENAVIGALKGLKEVFEKREREYQRQLEALLLQARIEE
jgi:VIT1/CCC1 family predicted Fe2+/Mn2+ transporter